MIGEPGKRWKESDRVRKIEDRKERRGMSGAGISVEGGELNVVMLDVVMLYVVMLDILAGREQGDQTDGFV